MFSIGYLIWACVAAGMVLGMGLYFNRRLHMFWSILLFIFTYFAAWLMLPPLSMHMSATWLWMFVISIAASAIVFLSSGNGRSTYVQPRYLLSVFWVPVLIFAGLIIFSIGSSSIFFSKEKASVIKIVDHGRKDTQVQLVSQERALRVTANLALKRGAELMGNAKTPGLASVATFGEVYGNVTPEGKAVWMAPLVHTGFWRWLDHRTTPGYLIVSHTNVADSRIVEDRTIRYGVEGFFFNNDLNRHLYINGYINYQYGDAFFQIDDEGVPHYVVPLEQPQVGLRSYFPEKWAIVNATSGVITEVSSHSSLPKWVDRAYSQSVIHDRFDDWGCLSGNRGFLAEWWNCHFGHVDVIAPTPGMVVTMDSENKMIYYTGTQFAQTASSRGATSGVAIVNPRTGVVDFYRRSGITETAAVQIMNGAVSNFAGWDAEKPVLIHVNGLETYFSVITDGSGARKGYGMVWQSSRDVFGVSETVEGAVRDYLRSYHDNQRQDAFGGNADIDPTYFDGLVLSLTPVTRDGDTVFYVRIDTVTDKVFLMSNSDLAEIAVTTVGEPVRIGSYNTEPSIVEIDIFDNLLVSLTESDTQVRLDAASEVVLERYKNRVAEQNDAARERAAERERIDKLFEKIEAM